MKNFGPGRGDHASIFIHRNWPPFFFPLCRLSLHYIERDTYRKSISIEKRRRITISIYIYLQKAFSFSLLFLFVDLHISNIQITHSSRNKDFSDCHLSWASIHIPGRYSNRWKNKRNSNEKLEQNIYRFAFLCVCVCVCRHCWMLLWWYKRRRRRRYYREKTIVEIEWEWESFINHERLPKFSFFLFYSTKGRRVLASRLCRLKRNSTDLRVFLSLSLSWEMDSILLLLLFAAALLVCWLFSFLSSFLDRCQRSIT